MGISNEKSGVDTAPKDCIQHLLSYSRITILRVALNSPLSSV